MDHGLVWESCINFVVKGINNIYLIFLGSWAYPNSSINKVIFIICIIIGIVLFGCMITQLMEKLNIHDILESTTGYKKIKTCEFRPGSMEISDV